jgi:hypothetical protein
VFETGPVRDGRYRRTRSAIIERGAAQVLNTWLTGDLTMSSYLYTNWRGKQFVIDDVFVKELIQICIAEGCDPEWVAEITPESLMRDLPLHEEIERLQQLEQMWEDTVTSSGG